MAFRNDPRIDGYVERGLTPTGIFRWYIEESQGEPVDAKGNPNRYHIGNLPERLGGAVATFRARNPELWDSARTEVLAYNDLLTAQEERWKYNQGALAQTGEQGVEDQYWLMAEKLHDAYEALAPELAEAGCDPLAVCR
jgi:hypothetical protein